VFADTVAPMYPKSPRMSEPTISFSDVFLLSFRQLREAIIAMI